MNLQEKLKYYTPIDNFQIINPFFQTKLFLLQSWKKRFGLKMNISLKDAEIFLSNIFNTEPITVFKSSEFSNIVWAFKIDDLSEPFYLFYSKRGLEIQIHKNSNSISVLRIIDFFASHLKVSEEEIDSLMF